MKRLWIACGILAVLFAATLYNASYLDRLTASLADQLTQAEACAEAGDWAERAVSAMARAGILDESTASGSASAPLTRRDACVMLCRAIERLQ